jgi:hypothetical protein
MISSLRTVAASCSKDGGFAAGMIGVTRLRGATTNPRLPATVGFKPCPSRGVRAKALFRQASQRGEGHEIGGAEGQ